MERCPSVRRPVCLRAARVALVCVSVALPAAAWLPARAAEALPEAAKVIGRFVEATGGQAAHDSLRNHLIKATMTLPAQQIAFAVTLVQARPNLVHSVMESPLIGKVESGSDGIVAWEVSTTAGPRIKEGAEKQDALLDATFDVWGNWRSAYARAEVAGIDTLAGRACYRVALNPGGERPRTAYFDRESGLMQRLDFTVVTAAGPLMVQSLSGDYRRAGGVLLAHRSEVIVASQRRVLALDSVAVNVALPTGSFDLPVVVKKLLEAKK
jgi:hypothetical protein